MDLSVLVSILFYIVVIALVVINRKKFKVESKILYLYRTKKSLKLMERLSKPKTFWIILSTIFILVAVYFMFNGMLALTENAWNIVTRKTSMPGAALVLPGLKIPGGPHLPLMAGIISIVFLAFVHELSHGIVSFASKIKIKNAGFGFLLPLPIPLAFVEPDEKKMKKSRIIDRLRIYASGSGMNICFAIIFMILGSFYAGFVLDSSLVSAGGIEVFNVKDGPLYDNDIKIGTTIHSINGTEVNDLRSFIVFMNSTSPGDRMVLDTDQGVYEITLYEQNGLGYLGGDFRQGYNTVNIGGDILVWIQSLIFWLGLLNLAIGIINFLPVLWITDGCKMVYDFLGYVIKKENVRLAVSNAIIGICTIILILNLVGPAIFWLV